MISQFSVICAALSVLFSCLIGLFSLLFVFGWDIRIFVISEFQNSAFHIWFYPYSFKDDLQLDILDNVKNMIAVEEVGFDVPQKWVNKISTTDQLLDIPCNPSTGQKWDSLFCKVKFCRQTSLCSCLSMWRTLIVRNNYPWAIKDAFATIYAS